ncbi:unnamed protein product [Amoebophrya sp. A120]|nr:unnamed protein product [Amoebophrya sp. A120]|eukprot:GSA120T00025050001.1
MTSSSQKISLDPKNYITKMYDQTQDKTNQVSTPSPDLIRLAANISTYLTRHGCPDRAFSGFPGEDIQEIASNVPIRHSKPQFAGDGWFLGYSAKHAPGSLWVVFRGSASPVDYELDHMMGWKKCFCFLRVGEEGRGQDQVDGATKDLHPGTTSRRTFLSEVNKKSSSTTTGVEKEIQGDEGAELVVDAVLSDSSTIASSSDHNSAPGTPVGNKNSAGDEVRTSPFSCQTRSSSYCSTIFSSTSTCAQLQNQNTVEVEDSFSPPPDANTDRQPQGIPLSNSEKTTTTADEENTLGIVPGFALKFTAVVRDMLSGAKNENVREKLFNFRQEHLQGAQFDHVIIAGFSLGGGVATLAHLFCNVSELMTSLRDVVVPHHEKADIIKAPSVDQQHLHLLGGPNLESRLEAENDTIGLDFLHAAQALEGVFRENVKDFDGTAKIGKNSADKITSLILGSVPPLSFNTHGMSKARQFGRACRSFLMKKKFDERHWELQNSMLQASFAEKSDSFLAKRLRPQSCCSFDSRGFSGGDNGSTDHTTSSPPKVLALSAPTPSTSPPPGSFFYVYNQDPVPRSGKLLSRIFGTRVCHAPFQAGKFLVPASVLNGVEHAVVQVPAERNSCAPKCAKRNTRTSSTTPGKNYTGSHKNHPSKSITATRCAELQTSTLVHPAQQQQQATNRSCAKEILSDTTSRIVTPVQLAHQSSKNYVELTLLSPNDLDTGSTFLPRIFRLFKRDHATSNDAWILHNSCLLAGNSSSQASARKQPQEELQEPEKAEKCS